MYIPYPLTASSDTNTFRLSMSSSLFPYVEVLCFSFFILFCSHLCLLLSYSVHIYVCFCPILFTSMSALSYSVHIYVCFCPILFTSMSAFVLFCSYLCLLLSYSVHIYSCLTLKLPVVIPPPVSTVVVIFSLSISSISLYLFIFYCFVLI